MHETPFNPALMALGEAATAARREAVLAFFGWQPAPGNSFLQPAGPTKAA